MIKQIKQNIYTILNIECLGEVWGGNCAEETFLKKMVDKTKDWFIRMGDIFL